MFTFFSSIIHPTLFSATGKKNVKAREIFQHRASRYGLGTLGQCSIKAGDGPFLKNDNSLILQSKISPFFKVYCRFWTVVILWDPKLKWKMIFCYSLMCVMVLRYIWDHVKLKKIYSENGNGVLVYIILLASGSLYKMKLKAMQATVQSSVAGNLLLPLPQPSFNIV